MTTETTRRFFEQLGLPSGDRHDLPTSTKRFADGAHYRIEIPSVEGPKVLAAVVEEADKRGVRLHRVSQGSGIMLQTDAEIREMAQIGHSRHMEVSLFVGPRAGWDGSTQPLTPDGKIMGWRHVGLDQLVYGFEDVLRGSRLGIRSVLSADEGLIYIIGRAREQGILAPDFVLKGSALLGTANPVGIKMMADLSTVNVSSSMTLAQLAALRQVIDIPIDLYIEGPDGLGGFTRYHELPEIIRVAAPVYLKFGLRNAPGIYPSGQHIEQAAILQGRERVRRAEIGMEHLDHYTADYIMSQVGAQSAGVPVIV